MPFPKTRMRRLRASKGLRGLVREARLHADQLILPLFVAEAGSGREPIASMPGVDRLSIAELVEEARDAAAFGIAGGDAVRRAGGEGRAGDRRLGRGRHRPGRDARDQAAPSPSCS